MVEACLTYLNFQHVKDLSPGESPDPQSTPFLEYSSLYWETYMRMGPSDRAKAFALELHDHFDSHAAVKSHWNFVKREFPVYYTPG